MLEVNIWFFAQLANFLLLLVLLNIILFKPFLRLFKERENSTTGALESARSMDREKDGIVSEIDAKLFEARNQAKKVFDELSKEGLDVQRGELDNAQNEAVEINRKAKEELEATTEKVRTALKSDIETFSQKIVEKLVGVR